jgi:hypothetical protein
MRDLHAIVATFPWNGWSRRTMLAVSVKAAAMAPSSNALKRNFGRLALSDAMRESSPLP